MKLVMLTCDQPWQRAFAARLGRAHDLELIVVDEHFSTAARANRVAALLSHPLELVQRVAEKLAIGSLDARDEEIYARYFRRIGAPSFEVSSARVRRTLQINTPEIRALIDGCAADAIVVSGTRLLRSPILESRSRFGMINMHTGLSPYYRGGPCTFWTLFNEEPEYAGVTIHYITAGIDSGDIILTARPQLEAAQGVAALDSAVIDSGHQLMLRALQLVEVGKAPRVPQWERGKLFLSKQYTVETRLDLEIRLARGLMSHCIRRLQENPPSIRLVEA